MLRLDTTLRTLEVLLGGPPATTQPVFVASWSDATASSYTGGPSVGSTSGTTPVTLVAAPASGTVRDVDYVSVTNVDSAQVLVTIRYNDNSSLYPIITAMALPSGSQLSYTHANGWQVIDNQGNMRTGITGPSGATGGIGPVGPAVYLEAEGVEGPMGLIGPQGAIGRTGSPGPVGPALFLMADAGEDGAVGPRGAAGVTGSQGPRGPAIFLTAEPGEDGMMGPPGYAGSGGGATYAVGDVIYSLTNPGGNWIPCDGALLLRATWPSLATLMGDSPFTINVDGGGGNFSGINGGGGMAWGQLANCFVATTDVNNIILVSEDGEYWEQVFCPTPGSGTWCSVDYGLGLFVVVGNGATGNQAMYSSDGRTWAVATCTPSEAFDRVHFDQDRFIAIGPSSTTFRLSTNGTTWSTITLPGATTWADCCWNGSLYFCVAQGAYGNMYTSPTGASWTSRSLPATVTCNAVAASTQNGGYAIAMDVPLERWYTNDAITWGQYGTSGNFGYVMNRMKYIPILNSWFGWQTGQYEVIIGTGGGGETNLHPPSGWSAFSNFAVGKGKIVAMRGAQGSASTPWCRVGYPWSVYFYTPLIRASANNAVSPVTAYILAA